VPEPRRHGWRQRALSALRHSLRVRLVVVFLLLALGLSVIFLAATQRAIGVGWRLAVAPLVTDYVDRLVAEIGTPPSIERALALTRRLPVSVRIEGPRVQWRSHPDQDDREWDGGNGSWQRDAPRLLERQTRDGHRILLGLGDLSWRSQPRVFGMTSLLAALLAIGLAYAYVRRLLRPIDDIRVGVQRFGRGDFDTPIHVRRQDELGELASQINTMADDLQRMLDGKRALLLAISHELRSPLTRARLNTELLPDSQETRTSRDALLRDLALMRDLIGDLLEGERLSGSHAPLQREPVDLRELVDGLQRAHPDLERFRLQLAAGLPLVDADPARLRLALRNLMDNALRHGGGDVQPPTLSICRHGDDGVQFLVRDHGPGVDASQLEHLGEAFYRTDQARRRETGGVGLGLHLARLAMQAHGVTLRFGNADPGLQASFELPAAG
jgi:signal transduction histidine kinase